MMGEDDAETEAERLDREHDQRLARRDRYMDYETTTIDAAARFERDRHPDPVRIAGQAFDPDDVPTRAELADDEREDRDA
jgi:hypothetical protein